MPTIQTPCTAPQTIFCSNEQEDDDDDDDEYETEKAELHQLCRMKREDRRANNAVVDGEVEINKCTRTHTHTLGPRTNSLSVGQVLFTSLIIGEREMQNRITTSRRGKGDEFGEPSVREGCSESKKTHV